METRTIPAMSAASTPLDRPGPPSGGTNGPYGRILVVTREPISMEAHPSLTSRVRAGISRRPWIYPAVLLGCAAVYLLVRRR